MKIIFSFILLLTTVAAAQEVSKYSNYPISAVSIKDVKLNDSFWLPKIKVVQDTTIHYAFDKCDTISTSILC